MSEEKPKDMLREVARLVQSLAEEWDSYAPEVRAAELQLLAEHLLVLRSWEELRAAEKKLEEARK